MGFEACYVSDSVREEIQCANVVSLIRPRLMTLWDLIACFCTVQVSGNDAKIYSVNWKACDVVVLES